MDEIPSTSSKGTTKQYPTRSDEQPLVIFVHEASAWNSLGRASPTLRSQYVANELREYWEISNVKFGMWPFLSAAATRLIPKIADALIESPADVEFGLEKLPPTIATEIAFGRRRKPTSRWQCCQCNSVFDARDGSSVPDKWWSPTYNRTQPKPWTCPRCQSWSTTIPLS